ncbi:MAG: hypothetical protein HS126_16910 [Anaerolineales bacterium]|nr:hypothetical protein [Anaerolineales bacterium]
MGDSTASIIFNLLYLFFWIAILKKMQRRWGNTSHNLAPQYNFSQRIGQWRGQIHWLGSRKSGLN